MSLKFIAFKQYFVYAVDGVSVLAMLSKPCCQLSYIISMYIGCFTHFVFLRFFYFVFCMCKTLKNVMSHWS